MIDNDWISIKPEELFEKMNMKQIFKKAKLGLEKRLESIRIRENR